MRIGVSRHFREKFELIMSFELRICRWSSLGVDSARYCSAIVLVRTFEWGQQPLSQMLVDGMDSWCDFSGG